MTAGIILQARLTSKRFPNKVLFPFHGKALIDWTIESCMRSGLPICVAIPDTKSNAGLVSYLELKYKDSKPPITVYGGWEEDVLARFIECNKHMKFDPIIRICADSPFIEVEDIKLAMELYMKRRYFTRVNHVQIFSQKELEYANEHDPFIGSREHVVRFMEHTVDWPQDIDRFYTELKDKSPTMSKRMELWQKKK